MFMLKRTAIFHGDPSGFLENINHHLPTSKENKLVFIEKTGHTYQQKEQEIADDILQLVKDWRNSNEKDI